MIGFLDRLTTAEAWYEQPDVHASGLVSAARVADAFRHLEISVRDRPGRQRSACNSVDTTDRASVDADCRLPTETRLGFSPTVAGTATSG